MSEPRTDVLIIGAGPAGASAAIALAQAGLRVRVVDRARFPREKLCGDTLNPGTLSILDRLGVGSGVREKALAISGMTVTGPGGVSVSSDYGDGLQGGAITRRELDLMLIEAAARAGARVDAGVMVRAPLVGEQRLTGVRVAAGAVGVLGEIAGFGTIVGAPAATILSLALFGHLLWRRVKVEEAALRRGVY